MKADLHIHTVLSPCGDLDMSPRAIVATARERGLDLIGVTDHNSTRQIPVIARLARQAGLLLLPGVEVTTREEAHCLAFFPDDRRLADFQRFLDDRLPDVPNDPARFGYQVIVDADDVLTGEEPRLLLSALSAGVEEIERLVRALDGLFIPAHVDKSRDSILSQLGFIPPSLHCDAIELSPLADPSRFFSDHPYLRAFPVTRSSDAHYLQDIGRSFTTLSPRDASFDAIRDAIRSLPPLA